jgi:hypothetical protein
VSVVGKGRASTARPHIWVARPSPRLAPSALVIMLGQNAGRPKQGSKSTETGPNLERDLSTAGYSRGEGRSEGQKICIEGGVKYSQRKDAVKIYGKWSEA